LSLKIGCHGIVLRALSDHKMKVGLIIPSHTSTNSENLVKIGPSPVLSDITCVESQPLRNETEARHMAHLADRLSRLNK